MVFSLVLWKLPDLLPDPWNIILIRVISMLISRKLCPIFVGFIIWLVLLVFVAEWYVLFLQMTTIWNKPLSYLGSPIHKTQEARANDARGFFRVASSLGLGRRTSLVKFARYIRYGFLSVRDAQDLLLGRLDSKKTNRYSLAKYWISAGFVPEDWFFFKSSALWQEVENVPDLESTTLFRPVEQDFEL